MAKDVVQGFNEGRTLGDAALLNALIGRDPSPFRIPDLEQPGSPIRDRWVNHPGSANFRPTWEAANGRFAFFKELAETWLATGLWGMELGSLLYTTGQEAAWLEARRQARAAGDTAALEVIDAALRANWAWQALLTVPSPITGGQSVVEGTSTPVASQTQFNPQGAATAMAGERQNSAVAGGQSLVGVVMAWVLSLPRRFKRYEQELPIPDGKAFMQAGQGVVNVNGKPTPVAEVENYTKSLTMIGLSLARFAGAQKPQKAAPYEADTPPEFWGLTAADRQLLRRIVDGDAAALPAVRDRFLTFQGRAVPLRHDYHDVLIGTTRGRQMHHLVARNSNKPAHTSTSVTVGGLWSTLRPVPFKGVGAPPPDAVEERADRIVARFRGTESALPLVDGDPLWRIEWRGASLEVKTA
jgi:hypothetical protein